MDKLKAYFWAVKVSLKFFWAVSDAIYTAGDAEATKINWFINTGDSDALSYVSAQLNEANDRAIAKVNADAIDEETAHD